MSSGIPVDVLEKRAADQRYELHNSVVELRRTVKEKLDVKRTVREYVWPATGIVVLIGLLFGYSTAGIFTKH